MSADPSLAPPDHRADHRANHRADHRADHSADAWGAETLDLDAYLRLTGVASQPPGLLALGELHEAHVRTFTFDNIDVLLDQHPGVDLPAVAEKFLVRGRGGYCFEHATLFAAVLDRLGYHVRRQLGRVDTGTARVGARTHMTVAVELAERWWLCDPGFGMSLLRPIPLEVGAEAEHYGWRSRIVAGPFDLVGPAGGWQLQRQRDGGWSVLHTVDALGVQPVDPVAGHHFTSTHPGSHFRSGLMLARYLPDRHVTVTHQSVTIRRAGEPTEHRPLEAGELGGWLDLLEVRLAPDERTRLVQRCEQLRTG